MLKRLNRPHTGQETGAKIYENKSQKHHPNDWIDHRVVLI